MIGSVNEITNLAAKAARGAGAPPALAAQFGKAAAWHLAEGHPVAELSAALAAVPNGPIYWLPANLLNILEDSTGRYRRGVVVQDVPDGLSLSYICTLPFACTQGWMNDYIEITIDTQTPAPPLRRSRLTLPDDLAADWQRLAARTFVPETDASRLAGAGAGLTDND